MAASKAPSKADQEARRDSPDRVLVRERCAALGPRATGRLVAEAWGIKNPVDAAGKVSKYLAGERTIDATAYVQLIVALGGKVTLDGEATPEVTGV